MPSGRSFTRANSRRGLEAAHDGHLHVHQNQVERLAGRSLDRLGTVLRNHHGVVTLFEERGNQLLIRGVVFRDQNPQRPPTPSRGRRSGFARSSLKGLFRAWSERTHDRVEQIGLLHGLAEDGGKHSATRIEPAQRTRCQQNQPRAFQPRIGLNRAAKIQSVNIGHEGVGDDEPIRFAPLRCIA